MSRAVPFLTLCAFMDCSGVNFSFISFISDNAAGLTLCAYIIPQQSFAKGQFSNEVKVLWVCVIGTFIILMEHLLLPIV